MLVSGWAKTRRPQRCFCDAMPKTRTIHPNQKKCYNLLTVVLYPRSIIGAFRRASTVFVENLTIKESSYTLQTRATPCTKNSSDTMQGPKNPCFAAGGKPFADEFDYLPYLENVPVVVTALNIVILLAIVASYVPQLMTLYKSKGTLGISIYTMHIASFCLYTSLTTFWLVSQQKFFACLQSAEQCYSNLLALVQSFTMFVGFYWFHCLYHYYMVKEHRAASNDRLPKRIRVSLIIFSIFTVFMLLCPLLSLVGIYYGLCNVPYYRFVTALSITSGVLSIFQWAPQIYTSIKMKGVGNFSLAMLLVQLPIICSMIVFIFLAGVDWLSAVTAIIAATQMLILSLVIIVFRLKNRKAKKANESSLQAEGSTSTLA